MMTKQASGQLLLITHMQEKCETLNRTITPDKFLTLTKIGTSFMITHQFITVMRFIYLAGFLAKISDAWTP